MRVKQKCHTHNNVHTYVYFHVIQNCLANFTMTPEYVTINLEGVCVDFVVPVF